MNGRLAGMWLLLAGCATAPPPQADGLRQADLFAQGDHGFHSYRIPSLLVTPKGTILAFAEARKNSIEDHGHLETVLRRSVDGGATWGPMRVVARDGTNAVQNPTAVFDRATGTLWLALLRTDAAKYRTREEIRASRTLARSVWLTRSDDEGETWSAPADITSSVTPPEAREAVPGPGVGIQLRGGRLVIPFYMHTFSGEGQAYVISSDDHGRTWRRGGTAGPGANECQVAELSDGSLMLNLRTTLGTGRRGIATSRDGGATWSPMAADPTLVEPVCQGSLIRYGEAGGAGKSRLLFSNPANERRGRSRVTVRLSYDEGRTWPEGKLLNAGPSAYSCLAVLPDGGIGCLYERGERIPAERITFAQFSLGWLTDGRDVP